jgi:tRNA(Ile)-lysidine synthase
MIALPPADPADVAGAALAQALAAWRRSVATADARLPRLAIGLSGGLDSMLLLDLGAGLALELGIELSALHVHHGLSPHADAWAAFCAAECAARGVPFALARVAVARGGGTSVEAEARAARHRAFAGLAVDAVALAHHADDQAETLLLQLLRGAGPPGLAAMPALRTPAGGPALVRPFLALPRSLLSAAAVERGLAWVEDESNADLRLRRNYLRAEVAPRLAAAFPGYPQTLSRAAAHQADAARLADELGALDAAEGAGCDPVDGPTLSRACLVRAAAVGGHRARNLLRWFLHRHALPAPSTARLDAMLQQLTGAAPDARVRLAHGGVEVGVHRGQVMVHAPAVEWDERRWTGEAAIDLPHGRLAFTVVQGGGIAVDRADSVGLDIRRRTGGERLRPGPGRARQLLTHLFQQHGIPAWRRDAWPLVFRNGALVAVPGIGVDPAGASAEGQPGIVVRWSLTPRQTLTAVKPAAGDPA